MPALPAVADVFRVRMLWSIQGKEDQGLRMFYKYTGGPPDTADLLYFLGIIKAEADSALPTLYGADNVITGWIAEDLSSDMGAVAELTDSTPGTGAAEIVPPGTCVVSSYEISRRYRGGHPRSYWPLGLGANLENDGTWTPSFVSSCQSAIDSVIDSLPAATHGTVTILNQVNVSYYNGFTSVENPITHRYRNVPTLRTVPQVDDIASIVVRPYVGSLRRRRPKTS